MNVNTITIPAISQNKMSTDFFCFISEKITANSSKPKRPIIQYSAVQLENNLQLAASMFSKPALVFESVIALVLFPWTVIYSILLDLFGSHQKNHIEWQEDVSGHVVIVTGSNTGVYSLNYV